MKDKFIVYSISVYEFHELISKITKNVIYSLKEDKLIKSIGEEIAIRTLLSTFCSYEGRISSDNGVDHEFDYNKVNAKILQSDFKNILKYFGKLNGMFMRFDDIEKTYKLLEHINIVGSFYDKKKILKELPFIDDDIRLFFLQNGYRVGCSFAYDIKKKYKKMKKEHKKYEHDFESINGMYKLVASLMFEDIKKLYSNKGYLKSKDLGKDVIFEGARQINYVKKLAYSSADGMDEDDIKEELKSFNI